MVRICLTVIASGLVAVRGSAQAQSFEWASAAPDHHGFDRYELEALQEDLTRRGTKAFLIVRDDSIVWEWYAPDHSAEMRHYSASLAKGVVGGLSFAVAMEDGRIVADDPASEYISSWAHDSVRSRITVRHLATHSSGIEDAEIPGSSLSHTDLPGWKGAFWQRRQPEEDGLDPFSIAVYQAPILFEPGSDYAYSNPGMAALSYAVTASLSERADIRSLLRDRIMRPIGIEDDEWSIGYGQTTTVDGLPLVANWGGGAFTARALARIGRLLLRRGDWDGIRILSPATVVTTTQYSGTALPARPHSEPIPAPAMGWYENADGAFPLVPRDAFAAAGAQQQLLVVIPSLDLIVVRSGGDMRLEGEQLGFWEVVRDQLLDPLVNAVSSTVGPSESEPPYPPSAVVQHLNWSPPRSIIRRANGSDNWPITWAADGHQYTAYGDGRGFKPFVERKLSLGIARIEGDPENVLGFNVRTDTGEQLGDGQAGEKASGMLMIDGVLYMWVRNANNSRLAWSFDMGRIWEWAGWRFSTSFGYPSFLNFGQNYSGARDDYVYVYSPDSDSAYTSADRMVLARVIGDSLRDRSAYSFFVGRTAAGDAVWSRDVQRRAAVFEHRGRCYRHGITYNAGLDRYLWVQIHPDSPDERGPRFAGGFGIYDAPAPWGPWTTVYFTELWDVGPGETATFPTKWMSEDGRTMHLVFSGDDHFSIRKAEIILRDAR